MKRVAKFLAYAGVGAGFCFAAFPMANCQAAPAAATVDNNAPDKPWTPVTHIDFSSKHNILILNPDGTMTPMDEPRFVSKKIAPGTWQLFDDGDYFYLIEGDKEAMLVDGGYGAGNPRAFAQSLTKKPIHSIANTHSHFDHVANDGYFDRAYMSQKTKDELPKPSGSFAGIPFPTDYPIQVIQEGYKFDLGNRTLEVIMLGNHTPGGTAYLDRKERMLFVGDEIMGQQGIPVHVSIEQWEKMLEKLAAHRSEYDTLCAGWEMLDATWIDKYLALAKYILAGNNGPPVTQAPAAPRPVGMPTTAMLGDPQGRMTYIRHIPRGNATTPPLDAEGRPLAMGGGAPNRAGTSDDIRRMTYGGATITYDVRKIRDQPQP